MSKTAGVRFGFSNENIDITHEQEDDEVEFIQQSQLQDIVSNSEMADIPYQPKNNLNNVSEITEIDDRPKTVI